MFSFAQNRFQIFDTDISTFVACKKSLRIDLFDFFTLLKNILKMC